MSERIDGPRKPRLLVILEAGTAIPSGVLRAKIYHQCLIDAGFEVRYRNRLRPGLVRLRETPPDWLVPLMTGWVAQVLAGLIRSLALVSEFFIVRAARRADVVYMSKVSSLGLVRKLRAGTAAPLVFDFGDAVWIKLLGFDEVLRLVHYVTTDNEYTAAYVRRFNRQCTVVPDCAQVEWFDQQRHKRAANPDGTITLGWIGSPRTAHNLFALWEALEQLCVRYDHLRVRLLGVGDDSPYLPPFEKVRYTCLPHYSQASMIDEVLAMDIGVFPLHQVEASVVRGVLKATVYMAGGIPAVCSPVGQCVDLIDDGVNGFLAGSTREWEHKLSCLIEDQALRERIGQAGLETVRRDFSLEGGFSRLRGVLEQAMAERSGRDAGKAATGTDGA
ncbi:MAG: glycosyltransferase family 4 protein [Acidobacteriota bacterium]